MDQSAAIKRVLGRIVVAHLCGLYALGVWGTFGTSAGFSLFGGGWAVFLGGILSIPLIVPVLLLASSLATQIEEHPLWFAACGPIVIGAIAILAVDWQAGAVVAASGAISSVFYLLMVLCGRWREQLGVNRRSD